MPPVASTNRPSRDSRASVNAPRRTPNSSASTSPLGSAAQLTWTNGPLAARAAVVDPARQRALAAAALAGDQHAWRRSARRGARCRAPCFIAGLVGDQVAARLARRARGAAGRSRAASCARAARARSRTAAPAILNGLVTKSHAPARTAWTASSMLPNAVIIRTSWPGLRSRIAASSSVPRSSGISTSVIDDVEVVGDRRARAPARAEVSPSAS